MTSTESCSLSINFFTTYDCAVSKSLLKFVFRTNTLFVHKFLDGFPSLRREGRPVRYHTALRLCMCVSVCLCASYFKICTGFWSSGILDMNIISLETTPTS